MLGTADLGFWRDQLGGEGFHPVPFEGQARVLVSATNAKFHRIPFRELSFSVFVSRRMGSLDAEGLYLVHAFNSVRFFAFVERTLFSTPYYPAALEVDLGPSVGIELREKARVPFRAAMSQRPSGSASEDGWEGPIFLPRKGGAAGKLFFARLRGETTVAPFDPSSDTVTIEPSPTHPIFDWLVRSAFTPREWTLRPSATHGKSKTVPLDSPEWFRSSRR